MDELSFLSMVRRAREAYVEISNSPSRVGDDQAVWGRWEIDGGSSSSSG
jgi:hypothetical protein